ncbi:cia[2]: Probable cytosolic iron-sulfur protein assembly protein 1 [Gossypium arboreum]|uniref:Cia[2]: Probable cytosolic iron-sulfur protein assembly protein 1 n=1 Tax=Gossypium arboreum TaxID=29729 RepID=A0A0B0P0K9_GOSAR|nr:cia[2]: Probable cytosolic iron-sulfur protein assembly protein 1 [Gossypium arboreum]
MGWPPGVRRKRTMVAKGASFSILLAILAGSYGSVIERFQRREGLKEMIKGAWAASFVVAILKKLNSKNGSKMEGPIPHYRKWNLKWLKL